MFFLRHDETLKVALLQALNCLAFSRRDNKLKLFCWYTKPIFSNVYIQQIKLYCMFKE